MKAVKHCRHVKDDGVVCQSPAVRGQSYCYFHLRYKRYPLRTWSNQHRLGGLRLTRGMAFNLRVAEANLKRVERTAGVGDLSGSKARTFAPLGPADDRR